MSEGLAIARVERTSRIVAEHSLPVLADLRRSMAVPHLAGNGFPIEANHAAWLWELSPIPNAGGSTGKASFLSKVKTTWQ